MMVLTRYNFLEYAQFITDPDMPKGAPKMFYAQLEFNVDDFLEGIPGQSLHPLFRARHTSCPPEGSHHGGSEQAGKNTKGLSLDCPVDRISYKFLRHGFMFASKDKTKFYPLLSLEDVEKTYYKFWKNM